MALAVSRHRRSRRGLWVGVLAAVVGIALIGGAAVAYVRGTGDECGGGAVDVTVAASPDQFPIMSQLAQEWNQTESDGAGGCEQVTVEAAPPSFVATTLSAGWDEQRDGSRPDVWAPDSTTWLAVAAARAEAATMLPAQPPSLASSPVVLAMQRPMAEALGWPEEQLGWGLLIEAFAEGRTWEQFGHPEWGQLAVGFPDPTRSTAGQAGVLTVLDPDDDGELSDPELVGGIAFTQLLTAPEEDTAALLRTYAETVEGAEELPAGFPVPERELAGYAAEAPAVPLVPVYPREGVVVADYPYAVLDAPWVDQAHRRVAEEFLAYLQGEAGRRAYADAGFRAPDGSSAGVALLAESRGFPAEVPVPVRVPRPEVLGELLAVWPAFVRPNNALIVLDTSGSMDDVVPGAEVTRLQLLQAAATEGIGLLNNATIVGLWEFSTGLTPTTPYRELVPMGRADEQLGEGNRRQAMVAAVQGLRADGGTGLYDTIYAGYAEMRENWQPDAQNMLVIITDGRDEFHNGRSREELLAELGELVDPDQPLPIIAMAVGPEADAATLEEVTQVTGGRTIVARDDVSAIQQVVLAFAGRIPGEQ